MISNEKMKLISFCHTKFCQNRMFRPRYCILVVSIRHVRAVAVKEKMMLANNQKYFNETNTC